MAKLDNIHAKLIEASRLLDEAAREMREGTGMPMEQISKVGAAIAEVMLVRHQIYVLRPDLMPGYLKDAAAGEDEDSDKKDDK
jgi:hypothetical protein